MAEKKTCPISKDDFLKVATPVAVNIGDIKAFANPQVFSTGSFGYRTNQKGTLDVNGTPVPVQVQVIVTAINSKPSTEGVAGDAS